MNAAAVLSDVSAAIVTVRGVDEAGMLLSQGSGFIMTPDGLVVTAWHVVAGAARAQVRLSIGAWFEAEGLVAWDADADFAVLKVDGKGLAVVPLGDSDAVDQGEAVLVVGTPLGLEQTASEGIVSAVREWSQRGRILQITAPISPGSSGGPLLNAKGEALGIVSFLMWGGQNLNFAVPVNQIKPAVRPPITVSPMPGCSLETTPESVLPLVSQVEILYMNVVTDSFGDRRVVAELRNRAAVPVSVSLQVTARDDQGRAVGSNLYSENIAAGETCPVEHLVFYRGDERLNRTSKVDLRISEVRQKTW